MFLAYRPDQPETFMPSRVANAVATVLYETKTIHAGDIPEILGVDQRALTGAIQIVSGMSVKDLLHKYRLAQAQAYVEAHPNDTLDDIAQALGYSNRTTLWRFFQRAIGETPLGRKSKAGPERWKQILADIRKNRP